MAGHLKLHLKFQLQPSPQVETGKPFVEMKANTIPDRVDELKKLDTSVVCKVGRKYVANSARLAAFRADLESGRRMRSGAQYKRPLEAETSQVSAPTAAVLVDHS